MFRLWFLFERIVSALAQRRFGFLWEIVRIGLGCGFGDGGVSGSDVGAGAGCWVSE